MSMNTENELLKGALEKSTWMLRCYVKNTNLNGMLTRGTRMRPAKDWASETIQESELLLALSAKPKT